MECGLISNRKEKIHLNNNVVGNKMKKIKENIRLIKWSKNYIDQKKLLMISLRNRGKN